jgi:hypothetical protein
MVFWFLGVGPWEGIEEGGHSVLFRVSLGELLRFCSLVMCKWVDLFALRTAVTGEGAYPKNSRYWRGGLP